MPELVKLIWDICCLRRGPQDVPYSPALLALLCVASIGLQQLVALLVGAESEPLFSAVAAALFTLAALFFLLTVRNLRSRFVQTACAWFGCAMLFFLLTLPLLLMTGPTPPTSGAAPMQIFAGLLALPLLIWKLMVDAHVLRHSLNVPFLAGMAIAVLWLIIGLAIANAGGGAAGAA